MGDVTIITGNLGQDGILLTKLLKEQKNKIIGISSRLKPHFKNSSTTDSVHQYFCPKISQSFMARIIQEHKPTKIFHLATVNGPASVMSDAWQKQNHKKIYEVHVENTRNILEIIKDLDPQIKLIFAGSSKMYKLRSMYSTIDENTKMDGEGIYAQSKIEARKLIDYYRDEFAINAGTAILFNHESKYRKSGFLFVEIAKQINEVVSMKRNRIDVLDANIMADWHSARDTVQALEIISQQNKLTDYVVASGIAKSVREIISDYLSDRNIEIDALPQISVEESLFAKQQTRVGNIRKLTKLGWSCKISLNQIIDEIRKVV